MGQTLSIVVFVLGLGLVVGFMAGGVLANVHHAQSDLHMARSKVKKLRKSARSANATAFAWVTALCAVVVLFALAS